MARITSSRAALAGAAVLAAAFAGALAAEARCTRLGFSVNDYGKEGPTKDAKMLLDKYVAKWAAERGIPKYTIGKKDVTCELFLDFIVFDEYTCRAEATVCWPGNQDPGPIEAKGPVVEGPAKAAAKASGTAPKAADAKPAAKPAATIQTGSVPSATKSNPPATVPAEPKKQ